MKRSPIARSTKPIARRAPIRPNRKRKAEKFVRNFLSADYVEFTRHEPCVFCTFGPCMCGHLLEARKMGGCGGDYRATGPVCSPCDEIDRTQGRTALLAKHGMTEADVRVGVARHQVKYAEYQRGALA